MPDQPPAPSPPLWAETGGAGPGLVVLLHGLGATGAVWAGVARAIEARGWRWCAPDLRGHGASGGAAPFGFGQHAADIAALIAAEDPAQVTLLGHSFGGVVAALVAGGLFGPVPARVVALGVKITWTEAEIAGAQALAARPARPFATPAEAMERHLKLAGLAGLVAPDAPECARGVRALPDGAGFVPAMDPRAFGAVGPSVADILRGCRAPLRLAAGALDPMVDLATMRAIDPGAISLPGLPHNAHVAAPETVAALLDA